MLVNPCCSKCCRPIQKGVGVLAIVYIICSCLWLLYTLSDLVRVLVFARTHVYDTFVYVIIVLDLGISVLGIICGFILKDGSEHRNIKKCTMTIVGNLLGDVLAIGGAALAVYALNQKHWWRYLIVTAIKIIFSLYFCFVVLYFIKDIKERPQNLAQHGFSDFEVTLENGVGLFELGSLPGVDADFDPEENGTTKRMKRQKETGAGVGNSGVKDNAKRVLIKVAPASN